MSRASARPYVLATSLVAAAALALSGCSASALKSSDGDQAASASPTPKKFEAKLAMNVRANERNVGVDHKVQVRIKGGELQNVTVKGPGGKVPGKLAKNSAAWNATSLLRPSASYTITGLAVGDNGVRKRFTRTFSTQKLTLDQQTYPSFSPTAGSTVGIAMPVIVRFDVPVTDKASIEKHLQVVSQPAQRGAWHWISDNEVHWRPKTYWKGGTKVTVKANIGGVPAGNGIFGQLNRESTFTIGRSQVTKVDLDTHQLKVMRAGKLIRTIPITAGAEPKYTTRSGIKVIVEKDRRHDMNSETIGIDPDSADGYDLHGVEYAMRITYSGEFLHAAPWSVGSQGHTNVSHGCTGMSTSNAAWLYNNSLIGDPVEFTGTDRQMTLTNGYGDWNESFAEYAGGSAL